jgi:hypothetical protein
LSLVEGCQRITGELVAYQFFQSSTSTTLVDSYHVSCTVLRANHTLFN